MTARPHHPPRPLRAPLALLLAPSLVVLLAVIPPATLAAPAASSARPSTPPARPATRAARPGPLGDGRTRLPNGWLLAGAGRPVATGDFPLEVVLSPDGRWAVACCAGDRGAGLSVVDVARAERTQSLPLPGLWMGMAFLDGGRRLAVSAGITNRILVYDFDAVSGHAALADSIVLGPPWSAGAPYPQGHAVDYGAGGIWPTGLSTDAAGGRLYAVSRFDSSLRVIDPARRLVLRRVRLPGVPYTCLASHGGDRVYVSLWSEARVAVVDTAAGGGIATIAVGAHPCAMAETRDGTRLFVANANEATVSVVDLAQARTVETLTTSLDRRARSGSTPDGVALDPAEARLYVANADANCVAVFGIARPAASRLLGFVPVGAYPTSVCVVPGDGTLVVANGHGTASAASSAAPADTGSWCRYLSYRIPLRGSLSIVPAPGPSRLGRLTRAALATVPRPARAPRSVVPSAPGGATPIRHVFYVYRENRSYDQVMGDEPRGDGDSSLCLFGERVTPNAHALARDFVLLDNTYCDADGSADGHNWGMAAYSADYVTKSVGTSPVYDYEGGNDLAYPAGGYLWDACRRRGVSFRSYGEFVFDPDSAGGAVRAGLAGLEGHVAPRYWGFDMTVPDLQRYAAWREEFDRYDRDGGLPQLEIIRLPNDHTEGTCEGRPTPRAHVAENDLALGRLIERISHSRYWKESVVIVTEDDAANGPDHVDAHRTVTLLAGPYVRRGAVDGGLYTTTGVLRTIELLLGLPPMSTYDAAATPLSASFTGRPDFTPYACRPARVDLGETNLAGAFGQAASERMNFAVADAAPPDELGAILWGATRGTAPPPPARGAWTAALGHPAAPGRGGPRP